MRKLIMLLLLAYYMPLFPFQSNSGNKYIEKDIVLALERNSRISFTCHYVRGVYSDNPNFHIEYKNYEIQVFFFGLNEKSGLGIVSLGQRRLSEHRAGVREIVQPYKWYFFYNDTLGYVISDIKYTGESYITKDRASLPKYSYKKQLYLMFNPDNVFASHQLEATGHEICPLDESWFDFETSEGSRYGKWLKFQRPIVKNESLITGRPQFVFNNIPHKFTSERKLFFGIIRWNLTDTSVNFELVRNAGCITYVNIELGNPPYISHIIKKDNNNLVEHVFDSEGNIEALGIKNGSNNAFYYYEPSTGMLIKTETTVRNSPDKYFQIEYDINKEYQPDEY